MMNYCVTNTATDMTPSVPVERESVRTIMGQTNELLDAATTTAEAILNEAEEGE